MTVSLVFSNIMNGSVLEVQLFPQRPLPTPHRTTRLQIITGNYWLDTVRYRHLYGFQYKWCWPLPAINRQVSSIYRKLPPVMKHYWHAGNVVMKSCTSSPCYHLQSYPPSGSIFHIRIPETSYLKQLCWSACSLIPREPRMQVLHNYVYVYITFI